MDLTVVITMICIIATLLMLAGVAVMARRATVRALVWWVGLACLPVGALLAGMVQPYLIDAWNSLARWWQAAVTAPIAPNVMAGLVVLGLGLLLMLVSRVIPHRPRKKRVPATQAPAPTIANRGRPVYDSGSQTTPTDTTT